MSVVEQGQYIAFAAYNEVLNQIFVETCIMSVGYEIRDIATRVTAFVKPTLLLLSTKICSNAALLEVLTTPPFTPREGDTIEEDGPPFSQPNRGSIPYRLLKTAIFDVRACKANILKLQVASLKKSSEIVVGGGGATNQPIRRFPIPNVNNHHYNVSSFHALASLIDFECTAEVQALGSLLSFIQSTTMKHIGGHVCVHDIVRSQASQHMSISADTFSALHIFATERHPLLASKGRGNSKEGFSLFSLLDRTRSRAGRTQLREWMINPLINVEAIRARQDGVELFMLPEMHHIARNILTLMERIGAVDKIIFRIQKCCAKFHDFLALTKALSSATAIIDTVQEELLRKLHQQFVPPTDLDPQEHNIASVGQQWSSHDHQLMQYIKFVEHFLCRCNAATLNDLFERITSIIDEEATYECKCIVIRTGFNAQLDTFKQEFDRLEEPLLMIGERINQRLPHLQNLIKVIFLPQVGFLVALHDQIDWSEPGMLSEDFAFIFTEANRYYFKNNEVRELDEGIGDLDAYIKDIEALILADMEDDILDCEGELRSTFTAVAELDCTLAFAACALDNKYVRPDVVPADQNCIQILNGRHPLQEIVMDSKFIPNSTNLDPENRVNVITGPNFSGKSCYARQVGILVFMTQIGCFIPCDAACISIVDQILARFGAVETCAVPQSSFQLDLSQMGTTLRRATPNTLVIIDEFGKGTSPASGIALLTAALKRLSTIQCKVICTTHFLEIFSMGLVVDGEMGVKALRMAVHIPGKSGEDAVPLFVLEEGVASSSAGLVCAKIAGVKDAVIARASEIVQAVKERRKIQPLTEILRGHLDLSTVAKEVLKEFIETNWQDASKESINLFLNKVLTM
jgi:DNA mismatch repair protein MSH5